MEESKIVTMEAAARFTPVLQLVAACKAEALLLQSSAEEFVSEHITILHSDSSFPKSVCISKHDIRATLVNVVPSFAASQRKSRWFFLLCSF